MAYEIPGFSFSLIAAADLSAMQFMAVAVDGNGKAAVPAAGVRIAGILQNKPTSGQVCTIVNTGISKMVTGAGVTAGALLKADGAGKAQAATLGATTGSNVIGVALETAGGANIVISVLLGIGGAAPTTPA